MWSQSVDLAQSTVSQHLKVLVEAGLVRYAPDRQRSLYEIDRAAVASLSKAVCGLLLRIRAAIGQSSVGLRPTSIRSLSRTRRRKRG